jgi:hypothetical protein
MEANNLTPDLLEEIKALLLELINNLDNEILTEDIIKQIRTNVAIAFGVNFQQKPT